MKRVSIIVGCCTLLSCSSDSGIEPSHTARKHERPAAAPEAQPEVETSDRPGLCARDDRQDAVRDIFCADEAPEIRSLSDLQRVLDLSPPEDQGSIDAALADPSNVLYSKRIVIVLGHSTALSGHRVTPLNPRVIILGSGNVMAFQRGVQKVEVVALSRNAGTLNFYLFRFEQEFNRSENGCTPGDLYTPRVERNWLKVRLEDDVDLANTPSDCRQCHQRGRETPALLMRELNNPWTHFFEPIVEDEIRRSNLACKGRI